MLLTARLLFWQSGKKEIQWLWKKTVCISLITMRYWQYKEGVMTATAIAATMKQKSNRFNLLVIRITII